MSESSLLQLLKRHPLALGFSVALHVVLLLILAVGLTHTDTPSAPKSPQHKTVQAVVVDAGQVAAEVKKLKQAEEQKKQQDVERKQQLQREMDKAREEREQEEQRLADLKKKKQQAEKEEQVRQQKLEDEREQKRQELVKLEKKRKEEQERVEALEKKRKAEEDAEKKRKAAADAEAARKQEEAELQQRLEEEQQRRAANDSRLQNLRSQYIAQIQQHVQRRWLQPAQMSAGWQCEVRVQQNVMGDVLSVQIVNCNGSDAFRNSVEQAVWKASPLPTPKDPDVFDKTLRFIFRPKT
jgi:colicin import membrane protein